MKFIYKFLLIISFYVFVSSFEMHPVHISYTKVNVTKDSVILMIKVFNQDLTTATMVNAKKKDCNETLKIEYLLQSCKITMNKKQIQFKFLKVNRKPDVDEYYFVSKHKNQNCSIQVFNDVCCNIFEDQKNLVIVSCFSKEKGFALDSNNKICEL